MQAKLNETRPAIFGHLKQQIFQYIQATLKDFLERVMTFLLFSNAGVNSALISEYIYECVKKL